MLLLNRNLPYPGKCVQNLINSFFPRKLISLLYNFDEQIQICLLKLSPPIILENISKYLGGLGKSRLGKLAKSFKRIFPRKQNYIFLM